jgi:deferrochelatase/peroxidase EfeB
VLWKNGTYISLRKIQQRVALFRQFLRENGGSSEGQELVAAKMMGRWRSGCPLALPPFNDVPALAAHRR